jgi:hypothetical protein
VVQSKELNRVHQILSLDQVLSFPKPVKNMPIHNHKI